MNRLRSGVLLAAGVAALAIAVIAQQRSSSRPALSASSCSALAHSGSARVPAVVGSPFTSAVDGLVAAHLRVSVAHFPPFHDAPAEQGWGRLANYVVVTQSPAPGAPLDADATVTLTVDLPVFGGPLGSMVEPLKHPQFARIPNLLGEDYKLAMGAGNAFRSGIYVRVGQTGPLRPGASTCGLNAFIVSAQTPRPGTRVRWGGVTAAGVDPSSATVTITLASRS